MAGVEVQKTVPANPKGSGEAQPKKKKKKNAPDRPQPAWLFPPDEENPVLNPKEKSQEQEDKDYRERMEAIKFLKHKAVTAPVKPAPPTMLLTLIGGFLASYGFNSTGRIFTLERNARRKLDGWDDKVGVEIPKTMPDLVTLYKQWFKDWQDATAGDDSGTEMVDAKANGTSRQKPSQAVGKKMVNSVEDTSSSGSESGSSTRRGPKLNGKKNASKSSSLSTSDSDADDEKGVAKISSPQPIVERFGKGLKRKTVDDAAESSSESDSDFDSDSDRAARAKKRKQSKETKAAKKLAKDDNMSSQRPKKASPRLASEAKAKPIVNNKPRSSSSSQSSSSSESEAPEAKMNGVLIENGAAKLPLTDRTSSADSSTTMNATSPTKAIAEPSASSASSSSSPSSSSASPTPPPPKPAAKSKKASKRKRSGSPAPASTAQPNGDAAHDGPVAELKSESTATMAKRSRHNKSAAPPKAGVPFQRIPENQAIDPRLASNAYVPYDYARQAHEDLIVTRGKGFTKEKNKKKRGSYRGGAIDVGGGKGIRFDD